MLLNGRYSLISGEMKYEIPVIPLKTFNIQNGSYVEWTGNVMNPQLNITATERVRATVGEDGQSPRMVSFDVGIALSQRLENLGLAFTLSAPEDASVQDQLTAMTPEERGKLAVTMLVTGMYMAEGNSTGGFNMNNALNSFLQSEISNIAGKALDISLGMETVDNAEDGGSGRITTSSLPNVSGTTVSVSSSVEKCLPVIQPSKMKHLLIMFPIEYRLDNSGTRYVKVFHDKNYESVLEGEIIETGVGIVLRKKMSHLGELFIFRKKKELTKMTRIKKRRIHTDLLLLTAFLCLLAGCSTTKNLPEGETLYVGVKNINVINEDKTPAGVQTLEEVEAALSYPPNNAILGSNSLRFPIPFGLWIYNDFVKYQEKKGVGHWIFNKLGSTPVYVSTVNPETRVKVATNLLRDYGFFNGSVSYSVDTLKNPRKAKLNYEINMANPYYLDSIAYLKYPARADSLIRATYNQRILRKGDNFSVLKLEEERQRLSTLFRNNGYYYFRPEFTTFRADTRCNPRFCKFAGSTAKRSAGRSTPSLLYRKNLCLPYRI